MNGAAAGPASTRLGMDAFVKDDGGFTSLSAALAILVSLALIFALSNAAWLSVRSADVQAVADAGALAGANAVCAYSTAAQVLDATVLSLGLAGVSTLAIGLVMSAIPVVNVAGPSVVESAVKVLHARQKLARSAAVGLSKLEAALPYVVAASSLACVRANSDDGVSYVGLAVPFPLEGSSDFGPTGADDLGEKLSDAAEKARRIQEASDKGEESRKQAEDAKRRGWLADCGADTCMRERASALAGLQGALNPDYPSSAGWNFGVAIRRARAYYQARLAAEAPISDSVDEMCRSAARRAFYQYALDQVSQSSFSEEAGLAPVCDLRELPSNTEEVRATSLYTDPCWPCTSEDGQTVLHASLDCPGATGAQAGMASFAMQDAGQVGVCEMCNFTVSDVGHTPSASTNIENGFEHHWREVVRASRDYQQHKEDQIQTEQQARQDAQESSKAFSEAIAQIKANRVRVAPPGKDGVVCLVSTPGQEMTPESLSAFLDSGAKLPARVAIAGAVAARDPAAPGSNVLADFFDGLIDKGGLIGATGSVLDKVMGGWGDALVAYGNGFAAASDALNKAFSKLQQVGLGGVGGWLRDAVESTIELFSLEPADMSTRKPLLVSADDVTGSAGNEWVRGVRAVVAAAPRMSQAQSLSEMFSALGIVSVAVTGSDVVRVAELEIPETDIKVPIEVDFGWLAEVTGDAA